MSDSRLDPEDWQGLRSLGRDMVDDMLAYLEAIRDDPVWRPVPEEIKQRFAEPVPLTGASAEDVYREFRELVLQYNYGSVHPRFWAWVNGSGTPYTVLAELLAAGLHVNTHGTDSSSYYVERQVVEWLRELFGMPAGSSGILLSGASMANFVGLAIALQAKAPVDLAKEGLRAQPAPLVFYASEATHHSVSKAARLLGLGEQSLRRIPMDESFAIDLARLEQRIAADRRSGTLPFCVVANAGTVDTGAIDPLRDVAALCRREGLWFHVDGAIGAVSALSDRVRPRMAGMEEADSLAFDLHKWLHMPYGVGGILVREPGRHRAPFQSRAPYITRLLGGLSDVEEPFSDYGLELTRGFRALAVWMGLKHHGAHAFAQVVEDNVRQAEYLRDLVEAHEELELLAPVSLNIVCFRYRPAGADDQALNPLNQSIVVGLQRSGVAAPSHTWIDGRFAIRVSITNHRSRIEDFDTLVGEVVRQGRTLR